MTAAIKSSLSHLNDSLQNLEGSVSRMQDNKKSVTKKKSSAHDLFSSSMPSGGTTSSNDVDAKALASRLDGAIAKVERLLREG